MKYATVSSGLRTIGIGLIIGKLCSLALLLPIPVGGQAVTLIGTIVGGLMSLSGTVRLRAEGPGFRKAFILLIVGLVLSCLSSLGQMQTIVMIAAAVANAAVTYFICTSSAALLRDEGNEKCAALGGIAWKIHLISTVLTIVNQLISWLPTAARAAISVISVLSCIPYLLFLLRASKSLRQTEVEAEQK